MNLNIFVLDLPVMKSFIQEIRLVLDPILLPELIDLTLFFRGRFYLDEYGVYSSNCGDHWFPSEIGFCCCEKPCPSPGGRLVMRCYDLDSWRTNYLMNVESGRYLGAFRGEWGDWSPTGEQFVLLVDGTVSIYSIDLSQPNPVTGFLQFQSYGSRSLEWSPAGLLFTRHLNDLIGFEVRTPTGEMIYSHPLRAVETGMSYAWYDEETIVELGLHQVQTHSLRTGESKPLFNVSEPIDHWGTDGPFLFAIRDSPATFHFFNVKTDEKISQIYDTVPSTVLPFEEGEQPWINVPHEGRIVMWLPRLRTFKMLVDLRMETGLDIRVNWPRLVGSYLYFSVGRKLLIYEMVMERS